ncbi:DUF3042 family protein [Tetragenococcus solitarius]|uniref:DUF3042 family protein n=1 Tax=Tetragenococcus solitarius TaxID=71453 RepID=A0ABN3YBM9_9ENTE|nr:DUF3042 family protein [Tetragenococcus solitarius]
MKKFTLGFIMGTLATTAATACLVTTVKKQVIEPIEEKEAMIDANRKKARRKSFAR